MKILLLQTDDHALSCISMGLKSEGFLLDITNNQAKAQCLVESREYDLIIVENKKGVIDAFSFATFIRAINERIPLIMIAATDNIEKRVEAFLVGYDDVLFKNTPLSEFTVRINSHIRRSALNRQVFHLKFSDLEIDTKKRIALRAGREIYLRKKEYELLEYMMHYPEQVLSRNRLLEHVWSDDIFIYTNTVDVHMAAVRRKIDCPKDAKLIHTIHGVGYMISKG